MSQAQLAAGPDRLPWLTDELSVRDRGRGSRGRAAVVAAAMAAIAAASFWIGAHSWPLQQAQPPQQHAQRSTTVILPPASPAAPAQPEVSPERVPELAPVAPQTVRQAVPQELRIARPRPVAERRTPAIPAIQPPATAAVAQAVTAAPAARSGALPLWPARISSGAYGRLVQIGAFGTRIQAKRGWRSMVGAYPAVSHLPAVVVEARNSRGQGFFRFQIGTTSQAHSEVLCQRMEKIRMSCAVVGLPWKPKGVER